MAMAFPASLPVDMDNYRKAEEGETRCDECVHLIKDGTCLAYVDDQNAVYGRLYMFYTCDRAKVRKTVQAK